MLLRSSCEEASGFSYTFGGFWWTTVGAGSGSGDIRSSDGGVVVFMIDRFSVVHVGAPEGALQSLDVVSSLSFLWTMASFRTLRSRFGRKLTRTGSGTTQCSLDRISITYRWQARSSIGFHVARKPPWKFQPASFFFCAGSWRRWPPTLQEDPWLSMFYIVFATVRARASGNEQRVRQTGVVPE